VLKNAKIISRRKRCGLVQLLGVTHLWMVSASRSKVAMKPPGYFFTDEISVKRVELKLGKILTMESCYSHYMNGQYTKRTKDGTYSTDLHDYHFVEG